MQKTDLAKADPMIGPGLGASRSRVLTVLQDASRPMTVEQVAEGVQLHANTIRFHLDGLVDAGFAERAIEQRSKPGRPRALYTAGPHTPRVGDRSYRLLAQILTSYFAAHVPQAGKAAQRAGRAWGRYLAEQPVPFRRVDAAGATRQLVAALDGIGFAPQAKMVGRKRQILLRHCPFRETAEQHQDVVCSVHLGLMQGLLAEIDAPIEAIRLDPFVEPNLCVAHLANQPQPPRTQPRQ